MNSFDQLSLSEKMKKNLTFMKYVAPTPIQAQTIPLIMEGKNVMGCAATGSGKTAAFAIPLIERALKDNLRSVILCPTRELAEQIDNVIFKLLKGYFGINNCLLIGGVAYSRQISQLRKRCHIVVATPGRLMDHLRQGTLNLNGFNCLVLDEADRMLDMGFAPQLKEIIKKMPAKRQNVLFSATFPKSIISLVSEMMGTDYQKVLVADGSKPVHTIEHQIMEMQGREKKQQLINEIKLRDGLVIVFARTKRQTDFLYDLLVKAQLSACRIHGDRTQGQRREAIMGLTNKRYKVMVATDVAARGIDIKNVNHVINYDLPMNFEDYIHRVGRTGRAGEKGIAVSFVTPEDKRESRYLINKIVKNAN